jgi:hypothetical protein
MSVLAEAISVIVCNAALQQGYPGAVAGFAADVPAGSFCTDGLIARAGFLAIEEAEFFLGLLRASGVRSHGFVVETSPVQAVKDALAQLEPAPDEIVVTFPTLSVTCTSTAGVEPSA